MYTYSRILVAVDSSTVARHAFDAALDLAGKTGAVLQLFYVVSSGSGNGTVFSGGGSDPALMREKQIQQAQALGVALDRAMRERGIKGALVTGEIDTVNNDTIADAILQGAAEFNADLIVMGTHGRSGVKRLLLGSVAECCVRRATVPVMMIPSAAGQARGGS